MSNQVDVATVRQYTENVKILAQQMGSMLEGSVDVQPTKGKLTDFDAIGKVDAKQQVTRHADTQLQNTPHQRRWASAAAYDYADLIDKFDEVRMLASLSSKYAIAATATLGRKTDSVILTAAGAAALSGENAETTSAFSATYQVGVADHTYDELAGAGNVGLAYWKLILARVKLGNAGAWNMNDRHIAVTGNQIGDLLSSTKATSTLYAKYGGDATALENGSITKFMGFNFHEVEQSIIPLNGSSQYLIYAWIRDGLGLAKNADLEIDIGPRRDKRNSVQVMAIKIMGAVREDDAKVIEMTCV